MKYFLSECPTFESCIVTLLIIMKSIRTPWSGSASRYSNIPYTNMSTLTSSTVVSAATFSMTAKVAKYAVWDSERSSKTRSARSTSEAAVLPTCATRSPTICMHPIFWWQYWHEQMTREPPDDSTGPDGWTRFDTRQQTTSNMKPALIMDTTKVI